MKFSIDYLQFKAAYSDDPAVRARNYARQHIWAEQVKGRVWDVPGKFCLAEEVRLETGWEIKCMRWEQVSDEDLLETTLFAHR